jgi:hypothetical protein
MVRLTRLFPLILPLALLLVLVLVLLRKKVQ